MWMVRGGWKGEIEDYGVEGAVKWDRRFCLPKLDANGTRERLWRRGGGEWARGRERASEAPGQRGTVRDREGDRRWRGEGEGEEEEGEERHTERRHTVDRLAVRKGDDERACEGVGVEREGWCLSGGVCVVGGRERERDDQEILLRERERKKERSVPPAAAANPTNDGGRAKEMTTPTIIHSRGPE